MLPTVVIGGYLGAGKTTLVNHLLRHAQGRRIAVLVNDFGDVNIDAALIENAEAGVLSLSGGCLCCSFGDDLVGTLDGLVRRDPVPDVCLIELSGVALPAAVVATARLARAVDLVATLVVADAAHIRSQAADRYVGDTVRAQLAQADWLMLNKTDLVGADARQSTAAWLVQSYPQARLWSAAAQAVLPELLLGWHAHGHAAQAWGHGPSLLDSRPISALRAEAAEVFESHSFALGADADLEGIGAALAEPTSGVLRAKGLAGGRLLQVAAGRWTLTPQHSGLVQTLVVIGLRGHMPNQKWFETLIAARAEL